VFLFPCTLSFPFVHVKRPLRTICSKMCLPRGSIRVFVRHVMAVTIGHVPAIRVSVHRPCLCASTVPCRLCPDVIYFRAETAVSRCCPFDYLPAPPDHFSLTCSRPNSNPYLPLPRREEKTHTAERDKTRKSIPDPAPPPSPPAYWPICPDTLTTPTPRQVTKRVRRHPGLRCRRPSRFSFIFPPCVLCL